MVELPEVENNIKPDSGFQEKYVSAKSKKMYAPLAEYLEQQNVSSLHLTIGEIEKIDLLNQTITLKKPEEIGEEGENEQRDNAACQ